MARTHNQRNIGLYVAALIVPLLLTGCITGLFERVNPLSGPAGAGGRGEAAASPQVSPAQAQAQRHDNGSPGGPAVTEGQSHPSGVPGRAGDAPGAQPGQSGAGASGTLQEQSPGTARQRAVVMKPDFSYDTLVITEDTVWHGEVHIAGTVTVAPQATLAIEPGTVIRFGSDGSGAGRDFLLLVHGRITARGTDEKPIRFTSRFAQPMAGDWRGIILLGTEKNNVLESCLIDGADTGLDASYATVTLKTVSLSHCTTGARFRDSIISATGGGVSGCVVGMRLTDSEADLRGMTIAGSRQGGVAERSSLYLSGGRYLHNDLEGLKGVDCRLKITGGEYVANGAGIDLESTQGSITGAKIAENADFGLRLAGSRVKVFGNTIVRNSGSGVKVTDGRGAAWGNAIFANGTYDLVNSGSEEFIAMGNWWGTADPAEVSLRISFERGGNGQGGVVFLPPLGVDPLSGH